MRKFVFALSTLAGLLLCSGAQAAITLDFSSVTGAGITFNANDPVAGSTGSFAFNHGTNSGQTNSSFSVTLTNGAVGPAAGLLGDITGTYNIGSINTSGSVQQASVTNGAGASHQFSITDASSATFAGNVNWIDISTFGAIGGINANGTINLSGVSYSGTNSDLVQLYQDALANGGIVTLSFQFAPAKSLTQLTSGTGTTKTSFSGSVSTAAAPAPPSIVLASLGIVAVAGVSLLRRRRQLLLTAA